MSPLVLLWVAFGGAGGAVLRWLADRAGARWSPAVPEVGVLVANVLASLLLGWVAGGPVLLSDAALPAAGSGGTGAGGVQGAAGFAQPLLGWDHWLLGTGLAGALSTFSTAVVQVARRVLARQWAVAGGLLAATWLLCAAAARAGAMLSVATPSLQP